MAHAYRRLNSLGPFGDHSWHPYTVTDLGKNPAERTVCFTPEYGITPSCTQEVVAVLSGAKKSILVTPLCGVQWA